MTRRASTLNLRTRDFAQTRERAAGFTLMEMLVTVALVMVLMLAVTQIFSIASKTIGGGQALGAAVRDAQAAQTVLNRDFSAAASDGACFIIRSQRIGAFRNHDDLFGDLDQNPLTIDIDGNGTENDPVNDLNIATKYNNLYYNFRNHRVDSLMFFARDRYVRQTGNDGTLVDNMTSGEAAIFIHHLTLPHTNGSFFVKGGTAAPKTTPGAYDAASTTAQAKIDDNPQNLLASQWMLGRVAMLLIAPTAGVINDSAGDSQVYLQRAADLTPLTPGTTASTGGKTLIDGRFDLAGTSITDFHAILTAAIGANPTWYQNLMIDDRFQVNPFVTRPITAAAAANQVPAFVPACTQFIVEFAGDFITQKADGTLDTTGDPTTGGLKPDGVIDFVPGTKQIRWYGLPRDTSADGTIVAGTGDVVPVRDAMKALPVSAPALTPAQITASSYPNFPVMPFEKTMPNGTGGSVTTDYYTAASVSPNPQYTVAWGPDDTNRPKLIRITLTIDRPEAQGRLADGQNFEYVFEVGQ